MIVERRSAATSRAPLPDAVRSALASIADEMRHAPRDVFVDRAELVHWLARLARRVGGVAAMTTETVRDPRTVARVRSVPGRRLTSREVVEAVFGKRPPAVRTITTRKGRSVRVETRRVAGQMELFTLPASPARGPDASASASRDPSP